VQGTEIPRPLISRLLAVRWLTLCAQPVGLLAHSSGAQPGELHAAPEARAAPRSTGVGPIRGTLRSMARSGCEAGSSVAVLEQRRTPQLARRHRRKACGYSRVSNVRWSRMFSRHNIVAYGGPIICAPCQAARFPRTRVDWRAVCPTGPWIHGDTCRSCGLPGDRSSPGCPMRFYARSDRRRPHATPTSPQPAPRLDAAPCARFAVGLLFDCSGAPPALPTYNPTARRTRASR
jgi:hypothetical protein